MNWFNFYGLIAVAIFMFANIIAFIFDKKVFEESYKNLGLKIVEEIGRYGCIIFMIFNIPYTFFGFWFPYAIIVYLAVGGVLLATYCIGWLVFGKGKSLFKMLWLSILPSLLFLFSGIMWSSIPLIVFAILFSVGHITMSVKNSETLEEK